MMGLRTVVRFCCIPLLLMALNAAHAVETHTKFWTAALLTGPVSEGSQIKYYLEPDLRFIDSKYKFNQGILWLGLGYQVAPTFIFYVGDATVTTRNGAGIYDHQNIPWQQANLVLVDSKNADLLSRTRLEEIKPMHQPQWAIVLRERLTVKIPMGIWAGHHHELALAEEVFFNLKHPEWAPSNRFIEQNRLYVGIHTIFTKHTSLGVGYMNQYVFAKTDQMSNILVTQVRVNLG